jgi:HK97 gp10 family phage protein
MGFTLTARATYRPRSTVGQFIAAKITPAVQAAVQAASALVVDEAKLLCPVDTGALQNSIEAKVAVSEKTVVGTITAGMPYAAYVEYGTGIRGAASPGAGPYPYKLSWPGQAAQPFLRPALDTTRETVAELMASQIAIGLKQ